MIEYTGNIQVHHPDRVYAEERATIDAHTAATINRLVRDQNNPDGDL